MTMRILIVGNVSDSYHMGSIFVRSAEACGVLVQTFDTSHSTSAPSMRGLVGKVFYRMSGRRPLEWWKINKAIVNSIYVFKPTLVLVTGIYELSGDVFEAARTNAAKIANYLTDSPWSPQNFCPRFTATLRKYDWIFSTKSSLLARLREVGVRNATFLPFGYDPSLHRHPLGENSGKWGKRSDLCLIGGADRDRVRLMQEVRSNFSGKLVLFGDYWNKVKTLKDLHGGSVFGEDLRSEIFGAKISLGIVRRANGDGHSMRSFEIPACGGCGIYEDTPEHRAMFPDYPSEGFFSSGIDLANHCKFLLENPEVLRKMRKTGESCVVRDSNTYENRLKTICQTLGRERLYPD